jgi:hypothetical protein
MWKSVKALTNMEMLPGELARIGLWLTIDIGPNESGGTRRERKMHITLTPDIIEKLNQSK